MARGGAGVRRDILPARSAGAICSSVPEVEAIGFDAVAGADVVRRPHGAAAFWRFDNNAFANDAAFNQLEFESVILGQRVTGLGRQQFDATLNTQRSMSRTMNIRVPHFDPGLCPTSTNQIFPLGLVVCRWCCDGASG